MKRASSPSTLWAVPMPSLSSSSVDSRKSVLPQPSGQPEPTLLGGDGAEVADRDRLLVLVARPHEDLARSGERVG